MTDSTTQYDYQAIDAVVNIWTPDALKHRPGWRDDFFVGKMGVDQTTADGVPVEEMLARMDRSPTSPATTTPSPPQRAGDSTCCATS